MKVIDAIKSRRSVRTFDGRRLSEEDLGLISACAVSSLNPYDIPIEWKILSAKESGLSSSVIVGTDIFIAGKMKNVPHAEEAFGYSFEKIVLYAESIGIGTTWIAGTMNRAAFERAIELGEDEVMPCVSPLGYPAKKMSVREAVMRKGVKADVRFDFGDLFFKESFSTPLNSAAAGELGTALEMVRLAPSAVNKQPWRLVVDGDTVHFYEKRSKGYVKDNGWDLQKIDIGIAMCHFASTIEESGKSVELSLNDPGIDLPTDTLYIASLNIK